MLFIICAAKLPVLKEKNNGNLHHLYDARFISGKLFRVNDSNPMNVEMYFLNQLSTCFLHSFHCPLFDRYFLEISRSWNFTLLTRFPQQEIK